MNKREYSEKFIKNVKATLKRWEKVIEQLNNEIDFLEKKRVKAWRKIERCNDIINKEI